MDAWSITVLSIFIINLMFVLLMIFVERKKPQTILSWAVILTILPVIGFAAYILFGSGLSVRTRRLIRKKKTYSVEYFRFMDWQDTKINYYKKEIGQYNYIKQITTYNKNVAHARVWTNNSVKVFVNGKDKIDSLKKDLLAAKKNINMEYYIFDKKGVGKEIMDILCTKARQGVAVKLIYDSIGCLHSPRNFFKRLKKAGGSVAEFFPPFAGIRLINLKLNYRNHRKIAVIDGKIGYTGGINIRDDHIGKKKKLSPWRDTHIRLTGSAVYDLQNVFFNDWRCCKKDKSDPKTLVSEGYFPSSMADYGDVAAQILSSGPEQPEHIIKNAFIRAINSATKEIYLQTPYFIPDEIFMQALISAKNSGVDVNVMIPAKPDKKVVYFATLSFINELVNKGIKVYAYNGFLHSKTLVVDDKVVSIGTCNADNRSFALNFEITAFLYNKEFVTENKNIFLNDIRFSKQLTKEYFYKRHFLSNFAQAVFRLLSPIL